MRPPSFTLGSFHRRSAQLLGETGLPAAVSPGVHAQLGSIDLDGREVGDGLWCLGAGNLDGDLLVVGRTLGLVQERDFVQGHSLGVGLGGCRSACFPPISSWGRAGLRPRLHQLDLHSSYSFSRSPFELDNIYWIASLELHSSSLLLKTARVPVLSSSSRTVL